jgi:lipoate-protein ligase A
LPKDPFGVFPDSDDAMRMIVEHHSSRGEEKVWCVSRSRGQHGIVFMELDLILPGESCDGPMQMALDEVLLGEVTTPTLRIYLWQGPCVTFGYFQRIAGVRAAFPDLPAVRRWTGGGIVHHGEDFTFSLMIPKGHSSASMPPVLFYKELHGMLARWLSRTLSREVDVAGEGDLCAGDACFVSPAMDDLLVEGRKILGGAQRRHGGALLYQGSLQGVNRHLLTPVGLAGALSKQFLIRPLGEDLWKEAGVVAKQRYGSVSWNERR